VRSSPVVVESKSPAALDAQAVVRRLKEQGLPIHGVIVYDEGSDPNKKLGRPGGYSSKAAFKDGRITAGDVADASKGSVELGGGVEVFRKAETAKVRAKFIQSATQSMQILGSEYDYVAGGILLRLSGVLTPAQAKKYGAELATLSGEPTTLIDEG
jgi:hypothetical protein